LNSSNWKTYNKTHPWPLPRGDSLYFPLGNSLFPSWEGIQGWVGWVKSSTRKIENKESYLNEAKNSYTLLESLGVRFLRFNDLDIKKNMSGILSVIGNWIREHTNKSAQCIPCLSQEKEPTL